MFFIMLKMQEICFFWLNYEVPEGDTNNSQENAQLPKLGFMLKTSSKASETKGEASNGEAFKKAHEGYQLHA